MSLTPIDLFKGWPATHLLPINRFKEAVTKKLSDKSILEEAFGYGPDEGHFPLRQNIAKWLSDFYAPAQPIEAERICITGGASQNLVSILQVFTDPLRTERIWLPVPTYHLAYQIFEDAGFHGRMSGVPEDESGMDVDALEEALARFENSRTDESSSGHYTAKPHMEYRKIYTHVIYCVPSFSNPSGTVMSTERRESLVRIARKYNALIISDDVYDFLCWTPGSSTRTIGESLQRFVDIDRTLDGGPRDRFGNAVSNGSFSKLIGPGCRVGWAEGTASFAYGLSKAGQTLSGGAPSQLMSTFINELLESGFVQQYLTTELIPEGRRRYTTMSSAVGEFLLPLGVTFSPDHGKGAMAGGYYIWLNLPVPLTAAEICQNAERTQNLVVGSGDLFIVPGYLAPEIVHRGLRLCFMWEDTERLVEGVKRLAVVIKAHQDGDHV